MCPPLQSCLAMILPDREVIRHVSSSPLVKGETGGLCCFSEFKTQTEPDAREGFLMKDKIFLLAQNNFPVFVLPDSRNGIVIFQFWIN